MRGGRGASSKLVEPAGDLAFVPAYREGLLLHTDFSQTSNLLELTAPASPKGWRAHPIVADTSKFGVWLSPGLSATAAIGIGNLETTNTIAPGANAVIAQQIRDPQSGHFTAHLKVRGSGTNPDAFQALFANQYRCRLVLFQFTRPDKSATERMELASTEFVPNFSPDTHSEDWQTVTVEKRMAPVPGVNFTFGLGMGVAVLIEQKIPGEIKLEPQRGSAYVSIKQIQIDFQGWKMT